MRHGLVITEVNPTTGATIPGTLHTVDGANLPINQKDDIPLETIRKHV